jgi:hypothetical protein
MRAVHPALAGLALFCLAPAALAETRDEVAKRWAPVFFQEVKDPIKDLYAAYDFDGDWNGDNNKQNAEACAPPGCDKLVGTVYYTVIETSTHWFVQYIPYHPIDFKVTNGHEHDTESVLAVVSKEGGGTGKLQALETRFHIEWFDYVNDARVTKGAGAVHGPTHFDGPRPAVYVQMVGHGICGGFSPPNNIFPDLSLTCDHNAQPHIDGTGIVYTPDLPARMPAVTDGATTRAGYAMVDLETSLWAHIHEIGPGKAFKSAMDFTGERCDVLSCPKQFGGACEGNDGESPGFPWAQEGGAGVSATGSQFFDPAYTMSKRLTFPQPFSLDYCFNPYLSIADSCPKSTTPPVDQPGTPPADKPKDPAPARTSEPATPEPAPGPTASGCSFAPAHGDLGLGTWGVGVVVVLRRRRRRAGDV